MLDVKFIADKGNSSALFHVGNMYESGKGVTKNLKEAVTYYKYRSFSIRYSILSLTDRLASHLHNKDAQYSLGCLAYKGEGTTQSFNKAYKYFKLAADSGHAMAQFRVAELYYEGKLILFHYFVINRKAKELSLTLMNPSDITYFLLNRAFTTLIFT